MSHSGTLVHSGSQRVRRRPGGAAASLYGTLPRHVPPKPVRPSLHFPPAPPKPPIPVDTARKIYEDNAEIMKASTCRMNSSDTSSLTRSNANRRRIRWSQGELDMRPRFEGEEEEEEEETSTEDEEGSTYSSSSSSCSKGSLREYERNLSERKGRLSESGGLKEERRARSEDSCAIGGPRGRMTTMPADEGEEETEEEEAPPAIPPRRPPRPSRETRNSYSRSATLELPSHRNAATSRNYPAAALMEGGDDCSDYENDPRSLPEVCVVYNAGQQQQQEQQRAGAISRP